MKHLLSIAICAIMLAFCSNAAMAQENKSNKQRMSREQLAEKQARHIARQLALDDATSQKLVTTYCNYQQEVWSIGPRERRNPQVAATDAEAERAIKDRMQRSQKLLNLREKYYQEYSKFLTPKQIQRVYELEKQSMRRLARHKQGGQRKPHARQPQRD